MNITNPATGELITTVSEDNQQTITEKIAVLRAAQNEWADTELPVRIAILQQFASLLKQHIETNAVILTSETGKPLQQSRNEINGACSRIDWLTANAEKYLSPEWMVEEGGTREKIVYETQSTNS